MDYGAIFEFNSHGLIIEFHQESDRNKGQCLILMNFELKRLCKCEANTTERLRYSPYKLHDRLCCPTG